MQTRRAILGVIKNNEGHYADIALKQLRKKSDKKSEGEGTIKRYRLRLTYKVNEQVLRAIDKLLSFIVPTDVHLFK